MRQGLQHGCALGGHVAPSSAVSGSLGMEAAQRQQLIDVRDGVLLGSTRLIEPERTEDIEGISIEIGEFFPLPPHALRPGFDLLGRYEGMCVEEDGAELRVAAGRTSRHKSCGPGEPVEVLEGIFGEGLTYRLVVSGTQYRQMLLP